MKIMAEDPVSLTGIHVLRINPLSIQSKFLMRLIKNSAVSFPRN